MLEHYYNLFKLKSDDLLTDYKVTIPIVFYAYVVERRNKNSYAVINLIDEFGANMAAHGVIKKCNLQPYLNKVIKFTGVIYPYGEDELSDDDTNETKYGVRILKENGLGEKYEIEVITGHPHTLGTSPWNMITEDNPNVLIKVEELSNKYNKLDIGVQMELLVNIEDTLNTISMNMFNVPNLIYPIILTNFLMRDDIYDDKVLIYNHRHLNILMTIVVDYILGIKPKTFDELMKVIIYVVSNYLGYDLENPTDYSKFNEVVDYMGIAKDNSRHYLRNAKRNAGGQKAILEYIPDEYKIKPGDIHELAMIQFAKRLIIELGL